MSVKAPDPATVMKTVLKLALVSLLVGVVLSWLEIRPQDIFDNFGETVAAVFDKATELLEWSAEYIVLGAVIVVPLWLIVTVVNALSGRRRKD
ncbi:MAG: DUF6460 domain-containing protein [Marivibrio sp.]|uniref:DUF6460 domain-containing protein n=1 Tax=Marivibrio sp. TaxID=2039719 RepID=UPI0032EC15EC